MFVFTPAQVFNEAIKAAWDYKTKGSDFIHEVMDLLDDVRAPPAKSHCFAFTGLSHCCSIPSQLLAAPSAVTAVAMAVATAPVGITGSRLFPLWCLTGGSASAQSFVSGADFDPVLIFHPIRIPWVRVVPQLLVRERGHRRRLQSCTPL